MIAHLFQCALWIDETLLKMIKEDFNLFDKYVQLDAYTLTRNETSTRPKEIVKVDAEIDERVRGLYGLG
jgi:hypothetical protein